LITKEVIFMTTTQIDFDLPITQTQLERSPKLGKARDFTKKFALMKSDACFSSFKNGSQVSVERALYAEEIRSTLSQTRPECLNRRLRGEKSFSQIELDFFRAALVARYGDLFKDKKILSDHEFLTCKADTFSTLIKQVSYSQDWSNYDPVHALLNLITNERNQLNIDFEFAEAPSYRYPKMRKNSKLQEEFPDPIKTLGKDDWFKITVKKDRDDVQVIGKPILLAISHVNKFKEKGLEKRGQVQLYSQEGDERDIVEKSENVDKFKNYNFEKLNDPDANKKRGYWIYGDEKSDFMNIHGFKGDFFFLAIGNFRRDLSGFFPDGTNLEILSTKHLAKLYEELNLVANGQDDIVYGLMSYKIDG